ncbi:MAG: hypothetical protein JXB30_01980 [Anaerolineae bacterium]|nr:hypothetical protein [Anaerolineae bacterium]
MTGKREKVTIQRENEKGQQWGWQGCWLELDDVTGMLQLSQAGIIGGKWNIAIRPDQLTSFTIEMISDSSSTAMMYGGGVLGYGVAALMSRWVKMPVIRLEQQAAEPGQKWVQIRGGGLSPRKTTRDLAKRIASVFQEKGYKGMLPDLVDDTPWKYPIMPVLAGCGLVIAAVLLLTICLIAVGGLE